MPHRHHHGDEGRRAHGDAQGAALRLSLRQNGNHSAAAVYEGGNTLVVDTIGQNDKTYLDGFHTPHTEKLHVVERYKLMNEGKTIQVRLDVDDPDTFYEPWTAIENLRRVRRAWHEEVCAENNALLFDFGTPVANKPDF